MRLTSKEIKIIKNSIAKIFPKSDIYLFGSRVDDNKIGGDIDLYIISQDNKNSFANKLRLKSILEDLLFKPVDIVISTDKNRLIEQEALLYGVRI